MWAYLSDTSRLLALNASGMLHKTVSERVCHLTEAAARVTGADVSQINAVDADMNHHICQWPENHDPMRSRPIGDSGCREVVTSGQPLAVPDTQSHPITCDMPWVGIFRGYLGVPITYDKQTVGALCVLTKEPRIWLERDEVALERLSRLLIIALD